jgi:HAT1-interacting factor 1
MAEASSTPAVDEIPKTKEKLDELTKAAALQYSLKNFSGAADHYADAVEIQAALNGEMAPENAELLFYYGRALYKVAISKSDVLGNKVAQEEKKKPKAAKKAKRQAEPANGTIAEEPEEKEDTAESKPYFQLTGTENWTDSEEEEDAETGEGEGQEEEQDDFQDAYEIFELSRVLYSKQLEAQEGEESADKGKGKGKAELPLPIRAIKEKLADCHGFLVEISLENERFHDAVADARQSLAFQEELNQFDHENVMEAHYSLSLALEFASNRVPEGQGGEDEKPANGEAPEEQSIDYELRKEAAKHTELTIQSLEARIKREEAGLAGDTLTAEQKKEKEAIIKDKKDILDDMKTRVSQHRIVMYMTRLTYISLRI